MLKYQNRVTPYKDCFILLLYYVLCSEQRINAEIWLIESSIDDDDELKEESFEREDGEADAGPGLGLTPPDWRRKWDSHRIVTVAGKIHIAVLVNVMFTLNVFVTGEKILINSAPAGDRTRAACVTG